jgi:hypothetical protein
VAEEQFGLPTQVPGYWRDSIVHRPWLQDALALLSAPAAEANGGLPDRSAEFGDALH